MWEKISLSLPFLQNKTIEKNSSKGISQSPQMFPSLKHLKLQKSGCFPMFFWRTTLFLLIRFLFSICPKILHFFTKAQINKRNFTNENALYMLYFKSYILKSNFNHTDFGTFVFSVCTGSPICHWFLLSFLSFSSSRRVLKNHFRLCCFILERIPIYLKILKK